MALASVLRLPDGTNRYEGSELSAVRVVHRLEDSGSTESTDSEELHSLIEQMEQDQRDPVWVLERLVRKIQHREDHGKEDSDHPACPCDDANGDDRPEMGDPVGASEKDASPT
ncbi:hypothetical protein STEG23_013403 [Scotinomys teguina]